MPQSLLCPDAFLSPLEIDDVVTRALAEDLGRAGDVTSIATIPEDATAHAIVVARKAGVIAGLPLVVGTTGWGERKDEVFRAIEEHDGALVYGANFSVGVNIFYRIVAHAAALFKSVEGYAPFIEEAHHARKRDAPSGTALRLRELMRKSIESEIPVSSTRAGYIPGTHRVGFDSAADQITLTHTARSREGFAAGALVAARWIVGRKGVYEFAEVIEEIVGNEE